MPEVWDRRYVKQGPTQGLEVQILPHRATGVSDDIQQERSSSDVAPTLVNCTRGTRACGSYCADAGAGQLVPATARGFWAEVGPEIFR